MNRNINLFNNWALKDKDKGMEKGHANSVEKMISLIPEKITSNKFSFIDYGCGNGWVVKKVGSISNCILSVGLDGAPEMIKKAKKNDKKNTYYNVDIENWEDNSKYDVVFSMEFMYYLNNPSNLIKSIFEKVLKQNGFLIVGIDHYLENKESLSWGEDLGLDIKTLSKKDWYNVFIDAGFSDVKMFCYGEHGNWAGTLIISGSK